MIIEGAFYKLPELMFSERNHFSNLIDARIQEATLVNYFTNSIMLEFNARNIENPMHRVVTELKYEGNKKANADIFVDLSGLYDSVFSEKEIKFGIHSWNYIEVKCFTKKPSQKTNMEASTDNTARVVLDLLRLQKYAGKNHGKYFLVFFDDKKSYYLANANRHYLETLFTPGLHENLEISMENEVKTFKDVFQGTDLFQNIVKLKVYTYEFRSFSSENVSGYLIKVL